MLMGNTCRTTHTGAGERRAFLQASVATLAALGVSHSRRAYAAALTKAQRDQMTAEQIMAVMQEGNAHFRTGQVTPHNYLAQQQASATGQYPVAVLLSCIDSCAPAETMLDLGIGDVFNARVAGNIANDDILGSLEFACKVAGAKVVLVMGHTACGAIKGAIDQ
jgi:carbonic anhydrase